MKTAWQRLIRFVATDGRLLYGEPVLPHPNFDLGETVEETKLQAYVIVGEDLYDTSGATTVTDEVVTVKELLGPLTPKSVPILRCIGLNYLTHIKETGGGIPSYPTLFIKPPNAVHDHGQNVVIPKIAQDEQADYEGELCVVLGKEAKDVAEQDALDYVAGYTVGNDVSARKIQLDPKLAGPKPQACFAKGFDTFAPLGPALIGTSIISDPSTLTLQTRIDGELRQQGDLNDLAFSIPYLIHYLSSGTTLEKGSVIMTGTPGGVGWFFKPPKPLVCGTKMEISVPNIGTLRNGIQHAE
ncbi:uncharacterized protein TRUGW13939_02479 [Talaromyces rugulosus]|uniref:Fumarylacetoacetase-like C-terminal domain-containing protein n=1 Tax=Talaromyces rugulosus TaxID=121627 RepID=A0A7H8QNG8_TALRU|nr:uncharacterized protein TRUGW13939_02479 [Talaromyces rugulosus]QKX55386.1 hypothetical protein TRUGW13939_02479 [Talaromyces rugulosus]